MFEYQGNDDVTYAKPLVLLQAIYICWSFLDGLNQVGCVSAHRDTGNNGAVLYVPPAELKLYQLLSNQNLSGFVFAFLQY